MPGRRFAPILIAHGLIQASFLTPAPKAKRGPSWPFAMGDSWLITRTGLDAGALGLLGTVLVATTVAASPWPGSPLSAPSQSGWFGPTAVGATIASVALLTFFFHPWIVLGFVVDAVVIWAVIAQRWTPGQG